MSTSIRHGLALALGLVALARVAVSQTPKRLADVPVPPAAKADTAGDAPDACWSEECRTYRVPAAMEEVFRFYQQRLAARPSGDEDAQGARDAAMQDLARGRTTPVFYQVKTWSETLESYPPAARLSTEPLMAAVRRRPPYRPNEWLAWARLAWAARERDAESTVDVTISDVTSPGGGPQTAVRIEFVSFEGVTADEPTEAPPPDRPPPEPARPMGPPSERELGVPTYPGARFDPEMSSQLSSGGDAAYYVYTTGDPPATVLAFYRQRTGKQPAIENEGGTLIAVRGAAPWPDLGVTIQPNAGTYPPAVKTMITIRKVAGGG